MRSGAGADAYLFVCAGVVTVHVQARNVLEHVGAFTGETPCCIVLRCARLSKWLHCVYQSSYACKSLKLRGMEAAATFSRLQRTCSPLPITLLAPPLPSWHSSAHVAMHIISQRLLQPWYFFLGDEASSAQACDSVCIEM
jgi:hypothetical protein